MESQQATSGFPRTRSQNYHGPVPWVGAGSRSRQEDSGSRWGSEVSAGGERRWGTELQRPGQEKVLAAEGQVLVGGGGPSLPQSMKMVPRPSKPIKMLWKPPH